MDTMLSHLLLSLLGILLLGVAACAGPAPVPIPTPTAPMPTPTIPVPTPVSPVAIAESLAQAFIAANASKDAVAYLDLFSYDAVYMDNGNATARKEGVVYMRNGRSYVIYLFSLKNYGLKMDSHFVSGDGGFIALSGTYTNTGKDGNPASVPIAVILEVKDGKLIREDVYYDPSPFY